MFREKLMHEKITYYNNTFTDTKCSFGEESNVTPLNKTLKEHVENIDTDDIQSLIVKKALKNEAMTSEEKERDIMRVKKLTI